MRYPIRRGKTGWIMRPIFHNCGEYAGVSEYRLPAGLIVAADQKAALRVVIQCGK